MIIIKFPAVIRVLGLRFGGSGLGNLLFVAGRAIKECKTSSAIRIFTMPLLQFNIGPIIRKERDLRVYWRYIFSDNSKLVRPIELFMAMFLTPEILCFLLKRPFGVRSAKVVEGLGNYFNDFIGFDDIVRAGVLAQLHNWDRSQGTYKAESERLSKPVQSNYIVIHIRGGDFPEKWRVDIQWYARAYKVVSSMQERPSKFYIITNDDSLAKDVRSVLAEAKLYADAVDLLDIESLLFMSKADYVIGNNSTFSAWGAYLGRGRLVSKFITAFEPPLRGSHLQVTYVE
jgi:hypothetical protein